MAEKEENVTRRLEKLSFEVAAGSFTFRNEIVLLLSLSLSSSSDRSFSLSPLPSSLRLLFVSLAYHDPPRCILERLRLRLRHEETSEQGKESKSPGIDPSRFDTLDFVDLQSKFRENLYFTPFCVPGGSFFEYRGYINLVPSIFVANYCILTRELEFSTTFLSIYLLLLKTRYFYYPVFIIITVQYRINIFGWM